MPAKTGKRFLGLSPWAWAGVIALGVVVFLYVRHRNSVANMSGTNDQNSGALDEGQLASDIGAQVAASLGGTPGGDTGGFDASWLADLMQMNTQSLEDFIASQSQLAGSGVNGGAGSAQSSGGGGSTAAATTTTTTTNGGITPTASQPAPTPTPPDTPTTAQGGAISVGANPPPFVPRQGPSVAA